MPRGNVSRLQKHFARNLCEFRDNKTVRASAKKLEIYPSE